MWALWEVYLAALEYSRVEERNEKCVIWETNEQIYRDQDTQTMQVTPLTLLLLSTFRTEQRLDSSINSIKSTGISQNTNTEQLINSYKLIGLIIITVKFKLLKSIKY